MLKDRLTPLKAAFEAATRKIEELDAENAKLKAELQDPEVEAALTQMEAEAAKVVPHAHQEMSPAPEAAAGPS